MRDSGALVFDGVADKILKQLVNCISSAITGGKGSWVTSAPLASMAPRKLISALPRASSLEVSSNSCPFVPTREYVKRSWINRCMRLAPSTANAMNSSASASSFPL
jgi:hypothetical protein